MLGSVNLASHCRFYKPIALNLPLSGFCLQFKLPRLLSGLFRLPRFSSMRETFWHVIILLSVSTVVFFFNLGETQLWDRDEPRNAGCAAEMLAQGQWVVPIFNDELRHQKPVLLYWLIMSAYSVFGVNEFSARFWSAALATGTTLATYTLARRLLGSKIALYAAIALSTSLMFDVAARAATPDSVLIFCGTTALMIYVIGTFARKDGELRLVQEGGWFPSNPGYVVGMYLMLGLGVLAKGPVGFLLPMAMIGLFMLIQTLPCLEGNASIGRRGPVLKFFVNCFRDVSSVPFFENFVDDAADHRSAPYFGYCAAVVHHGRSANGRRFHPFVFSRGAFRSCNRVSGESLRWHLVLSCCNSGRIFSMVCILGAGRGGAVEEWLNSDGQFDG